MPLLRQVSYALEHTLAHTSTPASTPLRFNTLLWRWEVGPCNGPAGDKRHQHSVLGQRDTGLRVWQGRSGTLWAALALPRRAARRRGHQRGAAPTAAEGVLLPTPLAQLAARRARHFGNESHSIAHRHGGAPHARRRDGHAPELERGRDGAAAAADLQAPEAVGWVGKVTTRGGRGVFWRVLNRYNVQTLEPNLPRAGKLGRLPGNGRKGDTQGHGHLVPTLCAIFSKGGGG